MNSSILNLSKASKGYMFQMQFVTFKSFLKIYQPTLFVAFSTKREFSFRKKKPLPKSKKDAVAELLYIYDRDLRVLDR